ncbi:hypothetical protein ACIO1C_23125 [Streptomyces sp. NPDC087420]|uniref:hypothetical protein n=1 Tax=Streptomyces sp. NPDC087420 TaxID=3365785 RepID=UPI0038394727
MHDDEDTILTRELGTLATAWGGSARLLGLVHSLLKKDVHEIELVLPLPFDAAVERVTRILDQDGRRADPTAADAGLAPDAGLNPGLNSDPGPDRSSTSSFGWEGRWPEWGWRA